MKQDGYKIIDPEKFMSEVLTSNTDIIPRTFRSWLLRLKIGPPPTHSMFQIGGGYHVPTGKWVI